MIAAGESVLVLGGAKSGKSSYAQALAEQCTGDLVYLATAQAGDQEMAQRIARHQEQRGERWSTLEEPLDLAGALASVDRPQNTILVDCLTLWLSNLMVHAQLPEAAINDRFDALCGLIPKLMAGVILVANEVGWGIVPENAMARQYRDLAGSLNQRLAAVCGRVVLVAAGLPLALKGPLPQLNSGE